MKQQPEAWWCVPLCGGGCGVPCAACWFDILPGDEVAGTAMGAESFEKIEAGIDLRL